MPTMIPKRDEEATGPMAGPRAALGRRRLPPAANDNRPGAARILRWAAFALFVIALGFWALRA
jgi:hypothetical protein